MHGGFDDEQFIGFIKQAGVDMSLAHYSSGSHTDRHYPQALLRTLPEVC
jgi:hypothetical protein